MNNCNNSGLPDKVVLIQCQPVEWCMLQTHHWSGFSHTDSERMVPYLLAVPVVGS